MQRQDHPSAVSAFAKTSDTLPPCSALQWINSYDSVGEEEARSEQRCQQGLPSNATRACALRDVAAVEFLQVRRLILVRAVRSRGCPQSRSIEQDPKLDPCILALSALNSRSVLTFVIPAFSAPSFRFHSSLQKAGAQGEEGDDFPTLLPVHLGNRTSGQKCKIEGGANFASRDVGGTKGGLPLSPVGNCAATLELQRLEQSDNGSKEGRAGLMWGEARMEPQASTGLEAAVEEVMEDGGGGGGGGGMGPGGEDAGGAEGEGEVGSDRRGGGEGQGEEGAGDAGSGADGGGRGVSRSVGSGGGGPGGGGDRGGGEKDGDVGEEMTVEEEMKIRDGAKDGQGPEREYRLKDQEPLKRVQGKYLKHRNLNVSQEMQQVVSARFEFGGREVKEFGGREVKESDTPHGLGMADGDVIEASLEGAEMGSSSASTASGVLEHVQRVSAMCKNVSMSEAAFENFLDGKSSSSLAELC
jgi:hypothetical protein